jgi:hypothetical protein
MHHSTFIQSSLFCCLKVPMKVRFYDTIDFRSHDCAQAQLPVKLSQQPNTYFEALPTFGGPPSRFQFPLPNSYTCIVTTKLPPQQWVRLFMDTRLHYYSTPYLGYKKDER